MVQLALDDALPPVSDMVRLAAAKSAITTLQTRGAHHGKSVIAFSGYFDADSLHGRRPTGPTETLAPTATGWTATAGLAIISPCARASRVAHVRGLIWLEGASWAAGRTATTSTVAQQGRNRLERGTV